MTAGLDDLPEDFNRAALGRCIDALNEIVADAERVRITITSEFVDAVRAVHEDKQYAEAYEQERPLAVAMAKTITQSDGSVDMIVDSRVFHVDTPTGTAEALFEHEAHHIAIGERGETLSDVRTRHQGESFPVYTDLIAMAGVACEEFRVVRQVRDKYQAGEGGHLAAFEEQARLFYRTVRDICQKYQQALDVDALARGVLNVFHGLTTSSAYVAAELAAAGDDAANLEFSKSVERLVLGGHWREVLAALQGLPLADTPTDRAKLDQHAFEVAGKLDAWLKEIGFAVECTDAGVQFLILNPVQWALSIGDL